jgi:hypothetical protein
MRMLQASIRISRLVHSGVETSQKLPVKTKRLLYHCRCHTVKGRRDRSKYQESDKKAR